MKKLSIGFRLTLWYLAIFALAQIIFGAGMWFILRHNLYDIVDDGLESQVEDLRSFLGSQKMNTTLAKMHEEVQETYAIEHSGDYLQIVAENGELIYQSSFLQLHRSSLSLPDPVDHPIFRRRWLDHRPFRFLLQKLNINGHVYSVTMGIPADDVAETLSTFRYYLLMFAPLLFLLAAGGGYWLSRRALSPVDALVRTAHAISGSNLNRRLERLETGDELQRLSDTLNEMLGRIEAAFLRVTEFTADASHELRTPVSLIRTEAELALRRSRGELEYKESLRHILLEAERTTALIEQLLALARADSGRESLHLQPVDLRQTLRNVVEGWQQVATIRNMQFSSRIAERDSFVLGDEAALRRVVDILLDNAFKFTSSPGSVNLALELQGENAVIAVQDSGPGIPEQDLPRIFERFYRVDKARSRELRGSGLGLAIAQWIITQHHGSIVVESRLGQGSTFRVKLPMIAASVQSVQPV